MHLTHQNAERQSDCRMRSQRAQPTTHPNHSLPSLYMYFYVHMYVGIYVRRLDPIVRMFSRLCMCVCVGLSRVPIPRGTWDLFPRGLTKLLLNPVIVLFVVLLATDGTAGSKQIDITLSNFIERIKD